MPRSWPYDRGVHAQGDQPAERLRLTDLVGAPVVDAGGERVGRLTDVLASLSGSHPLVTALLVHPRGSARGATVRVPLGVAEDLVPGRVALRGPLPDAAGERRPDEVSLGRDVLDVQIVDVDRRRVARVGEVRLAWTGDGLLVLAVDVGWRAILRRLGLHRLAGRAGHDAIDWSALHVAAGRAHALQLTQPAAAVQRLDPAGLAELVARLPRASGAALLRELPADRASAALAAVHPGLGADLVEALPLDRAAELLGAMPEHEAADALREAGDERRHAVLEELDTALGARLRAAVGTASAGEPHAPRRYWNVFRGHAKHRGHHR